MILFVTVFATVLDRNCPIMCNQIVVFVTVLDIIRRICHSHNYDEQVIVTIMKKMSVTVLMDEYVRLVFIIPA